MNTDLDKLSGQSLQTEADLLREEVLVARRASEITADLVVAQFAKMDEVLRILEEKAQGEQQLSEQLAEELRESELRERDLAEARKAAEEARAVAEQATLERGALLDEMVRQNQYLAALHDTTVGLISRLDVNELLQALVARAGQLLNAPHGFIYLAEPGAADLECRVGVARGRATQGGLGGSGGHRDDDNRPFRARRRCLPSTHRCLPPTPTTTPTTTTADSPGPAPSSSRSS